MRIARLYARLGFSVKYLAVADELSEIPDWLERIDLDPPLYIENNEACDLAFESLDEVYPHAVKAGSARALTALYGDNDIESALKKSLLYQLTDYFYYRLLLERTADNEACRGGKIFFYPDRFDVPYLLGRLAGFFRAAGLDGGPPSSIQVPRWTRLFGAARVLGMKTLFRAYALSRMVAATGACVRGFRPRPERRDFDYGIAIISPLREFSNPFRASDWLLDGRTMTIENTLFIPLAALTADQFEWLARKNLKTMNMTPVLTLQELFKVWRAYAVILAGGGLPEIKKSALRVVDTYVAWADFGRKYRLKNFITYADFGEAQIARNILLNQEGVITWYYSDSINHSFSLCSKGGRPYRHPFWGFLRYDHLVTWMDQVIDYFKAHRQQIGAYHNVGCLWSEHTRRLKEGILASDFRGHLEACGWQRGQKLVAVFDSWYHSQGINTHLDVLTYVQGIQRLLADFPDIFIVVKEKRDRWYFKDRTAATVYAAYEELEKEPRCVFPGHRWSPSESIALSDLVISFPFTSTTVEALGVGQKAIFFDPSCKLAEISFYDRVPGLVVHGYEQLRCRVEELLYKTDEREYAEYLGNDVAKWVERYQDGRAIFRFRELLSSEGRGNLVRVRTADKAS